MTMPKSRLTIFVFLTTAACHGVATPEQDRGSNQGSDELAVGNETSYGVDGADAGPPALPSRPPEGCLQMELSDPAGCNDRDVWQMTGAKMCSGKGLELQGMDPGDICLGGTSKPTITCCRATPPASACKEAELGDRTKCAADGMLKDAAKSLCHSGNVTFFALGDACGNQPGYHRTAMVRCCETPTQPAPGCARHRLGDGQRCDYDNNWRTAASNVCAKEGAHLGDISIDDRCGSMGAGNEPWVASEIEFTCCK